MGKPLGYSLLLMASLATSLQAQAINVWVINDGLKVKSDGRLWNRAYEQSHPNYRQSSAVWDDNRIRLAAARNEVVAFQVVIEAIEAVENLVISFQIDSLAKASIPRRHGQIFREKFISVKKASRFSDGRRVAASLGSGNYPDALIPLSDDTAEDWPALSPGDVAVFWVDIKIPADIAPGKHENRLVIGFTGGARSLSIITDVYDFTLPVQHSLPVYWQFFPTSFWRGEQLPETWFGAPENWSLIYEYYREAVAHRADLVLRGVRPAVQFDHQTGNPAIKAVCQICRH